MNVRSNNKISTLDKPTNTQNEKSSFSFSTSWLGRQLIKLSNKVFTPIQNAWKRHQKASNIRAKLEQDKKDAEMRKAVAEKWGPSTHPDNSFGCYTLKNKELTQGPKGAYYLRNGTLVKS